MAGSGGGQGEEQVRRARADLDRRLVLDESGRLIDVGQPARPWALGGLVLGAVTVVALLVVGDRPAGQYEVTDYTTTVLLVAIVVGLPVGFLGWLVGRWLRPLRRLGGVLMGVGFACLLALFVVTLLGEFLPLGGSGAT